MPLFFTKFIYEYADHLKNGDKQFYGIPIFVRSSFPMSLLKTLKYVYILNVAYEMYESQCR